jgi:hypothetical protein
MKSLRLKKAINKVYAVVGGALLIMGGLHFTL